MILVDFSQIIISSLMTQVDPKRQEVDLNLIRHVTLNVLRANKMKFSDDYGELVLCMDDNKYWRRDHFPYYKSNRGVARAATGLDWVELFKNIEEIKSELRDYMPYKIIQIDKAEADDIIGSMCMKYGTILNHTDGEKILILSSDKDFKQLQRYSNVEQYSPHAKSFLVERDPDEFLREHIIRGDRDDGVPNCLSQDDCFILKVRQTPITKKVLARVLNNDTTLEERQRIRRNRTLIDLSYIPEDIKLATIDAYETCVPAKRREILKYFTKKRLRNLTADLTEF